MILWLPGDRILNSNQFYEAVNSKHASVVSGNYPWSFGLGGTAYRYDSTLDEMGHSVADDAIFDGTTQIAGMCWIRPVSSFSANACVFAKYRFDSANRREWSLNYDGAGSGRLAVNKGSSLGVFQSSEDTDNVVLTLNQWHHVGFSINGTTTKIYVNGKSVPISLASGSLASTFENSTAPFTIGAFESFDNEIRLNKIDAEIFDIRLYRPVPPDSTFWQAYDPRTRWDLWPRSRRDNVASNLPVITFNPVWASRSNVILGAGNAA